MVGADEFLPLHAASQEPLERKLLLRLKRHYASHRHRRCRRFRDQHADRGYSYLPPDARQGLALALHSGPAGFRAGGAEPQAVLLPAAALGGRLADPALPHHRLAAVQARPDDQPAAQLSAGDAAPYRWGPATVLPPAAFADPALPHHRLAAVQARPDDQPAAQLSAGDAAPYRWGPATVLPPAAFADSDHLARAGHRPDKLLRYRSEEH